MNVSLAAGWESLLEQTETNWTDFKLESGMHVHCLSAV